MAAGAGSADAGKKGANLGYVDGAIIRIHVENFLTYDSCEVKPGPHLNMIIGPNTTGKSSIVCAICLGLAGKTALLGRAQHPAEFIKHGKQRASIVIELFNPNGKNLIIKRDIIRPNKSEWAIDGKVCSQKAVEEAVLKKNIQVGNLCQFLPQDRVADFAKMSPQELLENTEKAAGGLEMHEDHQNLKKAREQSRSLELAVKNTAENLDREKQKNARLEPDVKNYHAKQKHKEQAEVLAKKLAWVHYEDKRKAYSVLKERKEAIGERVKQIRAQNAPMRKKVDTMRNKKSVIEKEMKTTSEHLKEQARLAANRSTAIEKEYDKIREIWDELTAKRDEEAKRRRQVAELRQHLQALQEDLARVDKEEDVQQQLEVCAQNMRDTNAEMNHIHHQGEELKKEINAVKREINGLQTQLDRLKDLSKQRLNMLHSRHRDTYNAVVWLRENKDRFKGTIHEPLMLITNVKDPRYAKYVEAHINFNDMIVFVCEEAEDSQLFLKCVRDEQRLQINAALAPKTPLSRFKPNIALNSLRRYGFETYLRDQLECPDGAMAFLCSLYNIQNVPVGNDDTKNSVQDVCQQFPKLSRFYTSQHSYTVKRSKYSGSTSTRCVEIKEPRLLTVTLDTSQEKYLIDQLKEKTAQLLEKETQYRDFLKAHRELETKMNQLRAEKKKLTERKDSKRSLQQKINMKEQSIKRLQDAAYNFEEEEATARTKIAKISAKRVKLVIELKDYTQNCQKASFNKVRECLRHAVASYELEILNVSLQEKDKEFSRLEREFEESKEQLKEAKDTARDLLRKAKRETNTKENEELSTEMQDAFSVLPGTADEITALMHQELARAECTYNTDESVVEEYNKRKKEILKLQEDLGKRERALDDHQEKVTEIKGRWIGPLQELIGRINRNFSYFFSCMKCAGEVDLNIPENPEDYEKYGVKIKVKYRDNEPLRELTPHHQSGGERSVATVLFMMALQELTKCPFRCVDEINQGMDPQNERKVFELVVRSACREDTPQYFLLTPKLLPNLEYSERMTVLCVFNGPKMVNHQEWSMKKFIKRRSRLT